MPRSRSAPHLPRAAAGLVLLAALLTLLPVADAHAAPIETYPPRDGHLSERPFTLWAEFTEDLDREAVRFTLLNENLDPVPLGEPVVDGRRVTYTLADNLPEGGYVVRWTAADAVGGHVVSGAWSFAVGTAALPPTPEFSTPFSWPLAVSKYAGYAGLALLCLAVVARSLLLDPADRAPFERRLRLLGLAGAGVLLAAGVAYYFAQVAHLGASPRAYLASGFGRILMLRIAVAAAALAWFLAHRPAEHARWHRTADLVAVLLVAFTYGATGHTAAAFPEFGLGAGIATFHLLSTIAWTGGLAALALLLRADTLAPVAAKRASRRFSGFATLCVVVMALTGAWMMLGALSIDFGTWPAQLATPYGVLLGVMVGLGLVMMAMGGANRFRRLKEFLAAPDAARRARFRSNVSREAVLGVVVLIAAAGGTTLSPPAMADPALEPTLEALTAACAGSDEQAKCYLERLQHIQASRGVDTAFALLDLIPLSTKELTDGGSGAHALGHALGRDHYLRHGDIRAAVNACAGAGLQACLHGSIQEYFERAGGATAEMALPICSETTLFSYTYCVHGVGHGVTLALNYSLPDALAICDAFGSHTNRSFCYSGVMMENMDEFIRHNTAVAGHGDQQRAMVDPNDPTYPCSAVGRQYRPMCWVYQPQIMLPAVDYNITRVAQTCEEIPPEDNATYDCFLGLGGYIGGATDFAPLGMRKCAEMPSMGGHEMCIRGFVGTSMDTRSPQVGLAICRGAGVGQKQACYYGFGVGGARVMPPDEIAAWCRFAERGYDDECMMGAGAPL